MPLPQFLPAVRRALLALALISATLTAAEARRRFDVVAGDATQSLPRFAEQADREIVFSPAAVRGVKTNAVAGEFSAREALDLLVARTGLIATQDAASGALAVRKGAPPTQTPKGRRRQPQASARVKATRMRRPSPFRLSRSTRRRITVIRPRTRSPAAGSTRP